MLCAVLNDVLFACVKAFVHHAGILLSETPLDMTKAAFQVPGMEGLYHLTCL